MARQVGDLWPAASGSASLGVDIENGGLMDEIRPFATVHMNSGVYHGMNAQSGIIRCGLNSLGRAVIEMSTSHGIIYPLRFSAVGSAKVESTVGDLELTGNAGLNLTAGLAGNFTFGSNFAQSSTSYLNIIEFDFDVVCSDGNVILRPGLINNDGGQIDLRPFAASGRLEYRFGPHQSWYMKTSHSSTSGPFGDGFNPLVTSGQIIQMILEEAPAGGGGGGLQSAYDTDPNVITDGVTPVTIVADDHVGIIFTPVGNTVGIPLSVSGFIQRPTTPVENVGDMMMFRTAFGSDGRPQRANLTTEAEVHARSLGPGTLSINTGSGIVPIAIGSGVTQFVNIAGITLPEDEVGTEVIWHQAGNQFVDSHYSVVTGNDFITILVPGFYQAHYVASMDKTDGLQRTHIMSELWLNDVDIIGSASFAYLRTTDSQNTANGQCMFNAESGDEIKLHVHKMDNAFEGVRIKARECNVILRYISPPRGGLST